MKNKSKVIKLLLGIFVSISILILVIISLILSNRDRVEYIYEDIVLANTSTVLFPCNDFADEATVKEIVNSMNDPKYKAIEQYINWITYWEVGNRCPGKFQLEVTFNSEWQRIEIKKILKDQKIKGVPVFLRNV